MEDPRGSLDRQLLARGTCLSLQSAIDMSNTGNPKAVKRSFAQLHRCPEVQTARRQKFFSWGSAATSHRPFWGRCAPTGGCETFDFFRCCAPSLENQVVAHHSALISLPPDISFLANRFRNPRLHLDYPPPPLTFCPQSLPSVPSTSHAASLPVSFA